MKYSFTGALIALALSSCATLPVPKAPPPDHAPSSASSVSQVLPNAGQKYSATDISGTYFGVTGASGSVAVGVAFGVIGVLANVAYINAENKSRASHLTDLTSTNLSTGLANELSMDSHGIESSYVLTPSANIFFKNKTEYLLTCNLTARQLKSGWQARYAVAIDGTYDSAKLGDTEIAKSKIISCVHDAAKLFTQHVEGALGPFEKRNITSAWLNGKGDVTFPYLVATTTLPDRVIINDYLGIVQLRRNEVKAIQ